GETCHGVAAAEQGEASRCTAQQDSEPGTGIGESEDNPEHGECHDCADRRYHGGRPYRQRPGQPGNLKQGKPRKEHGSNLSPASDPPPDAPPPLDQELSSL